MRFRLENEAEKHDVQGGTKKQHILFSYDVHHTRASVMCESTAIVQLINKVTRRPAVARIADRTAWQHGFFSRPYWVIRSRLLYDVLSVCRLSVTFCIVAKWYVVEGRRWYRWIGRW